MNWIRHNLAYVIVALIAILLMFFTVQLQYLLLDIPLGKQAINVAQTVTVTPLPTPFLLQPAVLPQTPASAFPSPTSLPRVSSAASANVATKNVANPVQNQNGAIEAAAFSPEELLEIEILGATNLTTSEDDAMLVEFIKSNARAVGFIRYSSYLANQGTLRAVKIQTGAAAVEPNEDTVASGAYPFSRPLLLYTAAADLKTKPQLEGYIGCYLNQLFTEVETVGYTPPSLAMYRDALDTFKASCQRCQMVGSSNPFFSEMPACTATGIAPAQLDITGGSTVYPLSARMKELYQAAGFTGEMTLEDIGTSGGFERFCEKGEADLVGASRLVKEKEQARCRANNRDLLAFPVGLDLVVVVVSRQNNFVETLSFDQLRLLFTKAMRWSEINAAWSNDSIIRAIPNKSRGTFTFFVEMLYAGSNSTPLANAQAPARQAAPAVAQPLPTAVPPVPQAPPRTTTPNQRVDFRIGYLDRGDHCPLATEIVAGILERELGYRVERVAFATPSDLFSAFSASALGQRIDWTLCYREPADQRYFEQKRTMLSMIGEGYSMVDDQQYVIMSNRAMQRVLQQELPCVYSLLKNFKLADEDLRSATATNWLADHQEVIQTWTSCR